jgi:hypothetical protein
MRRMCAALLSASLALFLGSAALGQPAAPSKSNPARLANGQPNPNWVNKSGGWNRGGCRRYAMVNNCQVRYDLRDFQCKCIDQ